MEIELYQLDQRYAALRRRDARAELPLPPSTDAHDSFASA